MRRSPGKSGPFYDWYENGPGQRSNAATGAHIPARPQRNTLLGSGEKNFLEERRSVDAVLIGLESNAGPAGADVTRLYVDARNPTRAQHIDFKWIIE